MSMFFPLAMLYGIYFTFFLDSFLDVSLSRNNIIFSPLVQFFSSCDRKTCKKINGGKKNGIFPISIFFPHGPCCIWFPFSDSYGTEVHEMMIFTLGLNVHSSACKFNDFVKNNPDNCSFNHFFFPVYFYQVPFSLLLQ